VRRRLRAGELPGERQQTPQGFVWLVELPADASVASPEVAGAAQAASVLVEDALEAVRLRERVDGLERLVGELQGERDAWQAQAERHEEAALQLRTLVAQAQQMARALPAGDMATPGDQAAPMHGPTQPLRQTLWQRLRTRRGSK